MVKLVNDYLNSVTMYRLMLYGLIALFLYSVFLGFFGLLPYQGWQLMAAAGVLLIVCQGVNIFTSSVFRIPVNVESSAITALILFFVLSPLNVPILIAGGVIAMVSKYLIAVHKRHIFNPAALALVLLGSGYAVWWAGLLVMLPAVTIVGLLIVAKLRRFNIFLPFFFVSLFVILISGSVRGIDELFTMQQAFSAWPIMFFGTIMLTEPLTSPPSWGTQVVYGGLVGFLFGSQINIGPVFITPELALIIGNIFSYLVSFKRRIFPVFKTRREIAQGIYEFTFSIRGGFRYSPGQFLEWTFTHQNPDSRGVRRYFTIASSPSESDIKLGIRFSKDRSSSFKTSLLDLRPGDLLSASHLQGDFLLPDDRSKRLVFIAGGIGVTPLRSMIGNLLKASNKWDIVLFYVNRTKEDVAYKNIFDEAERVGLRTVYVLTEIDRAPKNWEGKLGHLSEPMIAEEVPDFKERLFYLSGPSGMVDSYISLLRKMGVPRFNIKTDYFPGY